MRTVVHVGMHRTGTTSIQETLFRNRRALKRQLIIYPIEGTLWSGHHRIAWALNPNRPPSDRKFRLEHALTKIIRKAAGKTLVLSSEDFEYLHENATSRVLALLAERGEVKIVGYFRHPVDWIESAYKWHVLREPGRFPAVQDYIREVNLTRWLDYHGLANRWSRENGRFEARLYRPDVVGDFLSIIGATEVRRRDPTNVSVRNLTAAVVAGVAGARRISPPLVREIDSRVRSLTEQDINLLDKDEYIELMQRFGAGIRKFVDLFLPEGESLLETRWKKGPLNASEATEIIRELVAQFRDPSSSPETNDS